jgi:hypothetical protein
MERPRPVWWKTRICQKRVSHEFRECPYYHQNQGVDDRHLLWPELKQSIPFTVALFGQQQAYYDNQRGHYRQDRQAALELERKIKFQEFEARGELKAIGCRVPVHHDWPSCRFGHSRLNERTGLMENDFDQEAVDRRKTRIAQEKAAKKQARIEVIVEATPSNFPAIGQTHK